MKLIDDLIKEIKGANKPDVISNYEQEIAADLSQAIHEKKFFSLPLTNLLQIIEKTEFLETEKSVSIIKSLVHFFVSYRDEKEAPLLLSVIKTKNLDITIETCIELLALFKQCDLCVQLQTLFNDFQTGVDYDELYYRMNLIHKETERHFAYTSIPRNRRSFSKKPEDFEPNILKATYEGKLSSIRYIISEGLSNVQFFAAHEDKNGNYFPGNTPLHIACKTGNMEIVKYLLKEGAEIDSKDFASWTPLHFACQYSHLEITKYLIEEGAEVNCCNNFGWTPLHIASEKGDLNLVEYLLDHRADINKQDMYGQTALHIAARNKIEIVKYLLYQGADKTIKDNKHKTPYDIANNDEIKKLLQL